MATQAELSQKPQEPQEQKSLSRREFLKLAGLGLFGAAVPMSKFLAYPNIPNPGVSTEAGGGVKVVPEVAPEGKALLDAHLEAPSESSAVDLRDYLNTNAVGDRVVAMPTYPETGQIEVAWSPERQRWLPVKGNPDTDPTGRSLPELFAAGRTYKNYQDEADPRNGADAVVDIVSGEEKILERIQLPGLEEPVSMAEFVQLGRKHELQIPDKFGQLITGLDMFGYAYHMMVNAYKFPSAESKIGKYFRGINSEEYFVMPVVLEKGYVDEKEEPRSTIYTAPRFSNSNKGNENYSVPAAGINYHQTPTNTVLTPIVDGKSGRLAAWVRVHLGIEQFGTMNIITFDQDSAVKYDNRGEGYAQFYGNNQGDNIGKYTFGLILHHKTTALAYQGDDPKYHLLEGSAGVLAEDGLSKLMETKDATEDGLSELMETEDATQAIQSLAESQVRLAALKPKFYFYPRA